MPNYANSKTFINRWGFYRFLMEKRGVGQLPQQEIPRIHNPTVRERRALQTTNHIWKYGDRYYKLAHKYYGQPSYWWVIAWYNGRPTEADVRPGDVIAIPLDLERALETLRAY